MSEFWSLGVVLLAALTFGVSLFLFLWGLRVRIPTQADGTTGHDWDGIREGLNRLPWWFVAYSAVGFIAFVAYLVLYPGLGNFKGVLGWSSPEEQKQDAAANDAKLAATIKPWAGLTVEQMATKPEAVAIGHTLYLENCAACHGSQALGNPALGAPDLTDAVWQYGGDGTSILASILDGRVGTMPPWGAMLNKDAVNDVAFYVLSLSGMKARDDWARAGKKRFDALCIACHGEAGAGRPLLGPDLTDGAWLWGKDLDSVMTTIRDGRVGVMPAWRSRLSEDQARLIAAWVVGGAPGKARARP